MHWPVSFLESPASLVRALRGDLDHIVQKAMAVDPQQRYARIADLAEDIGRHFGHRPVEARDANRVYRLGKFLRRYRPAVVTVANSIDIDFGRPGNHHLPGL
jgi:hypothetical protein